MKLSPDERAVLDRMAPGALCMDGFLGGDTRPLSEIIQADRAEIEALGTTSDQLAGRLREILKDAMAAQGRPVHLGEHLTATYHEAMGRIPCPWPGEGVFAKGYVELIDGRTGKKGLITPLSVHMIGRHGFYQGRRSRYRVEPGQLCRMLDLTGP